MSNRSSMEVLPPTNKPVPGDPGQEPSYAFRQPQQMTRQELVRAIEEWQANDDTALEPICDLLEAAKVKLAEETYQDGVGLTRCALCFHPVKD